MSNKSPPPPDYRPMAKASEESSKIMKEIADRQMDFAERQYQETRPLLGKVTEQQMGIADKSAAQGDDYYSYLKSFRPTEQAMMNESMGLTPDMTDAMYGEQKTARQGILSKLVDETPYQADLEAARMALGETPQQVREAVATSGATGATQAVTGGGFSAMITRAIARSAGSPGEVMQELSRTNPDFAVALAKMTESQKQALMVSAQNEAIRGRAAEAEAEIFQRYAGQASRGEANRLADYDAANRADAATITADDATVYGLNRGAIDARVGQAVADTEGGYTRSINQAIRQGLRYGGSESEIINNVAGMGMTQASQIAAAANASRTDGINDVRGRAATGLQLRQSNMGALNKERAINWAKKLDAAGLVKGLPGASSGAYGLAVSSGNSAGNNAAAAGSTYQAGLSAGGQTMAQGRQLRQQGLGAILNAQSSQEAPADNSGAIIGAVGGIAVAI